MHIRSSLAAAGAALLVVACGGEPVETFSSDSDSAQASIRPDTDVPQTALDPLFAQAAAEFKVPVTLLKAIGFAETRWQMVRGEVEFEGMPAAFGIMALRGERLSQGAALAGVSVEAARSEPLANLRAAAALLNAYAEELGVQRSNLAAWGPVAARYSGIPDPNAQAEYVHKDVYGAIRQGVVVKTSDGVVASLMPVNVKPEFEEPVSILAAGPDYAASIWRPSPNYNARPTGSIGDVGMIIIHTCEGGYSGCWGWLVNTASGVSAHYVVNESGSEISQLVRESSRAWHIGATYDCSLNSNVECWRNGYSSNHFTVGIEHGGFASQSSFPVGQIDASAKLSCDITRDQAIARDRYHIVAHGQLQPATRTDPGPNWPWTDYLNRINSHCGSSGTGLIVDSNNANNDTSQGYIQVSANWTSSTNVAGYYGSGYFVASTQAISDGAAFFFYLPAAATKTIDAWWTAATDRSTTAPFIMYNASGTQLATVQANQQVNGGKWNTLGTFNFTAGWNKVVLSRWTGAGFVVVADAVRIR